MKKIEKEVNLKNADDKFHEEIKEMMEEVHNVHVPKILEIEEKICEEIWS